MDTLLFLMLGGTLAGIANFFINYVELPFKLSRLRLQGYTFLQEDYKPELTWGIALIGYIFLGIIGSLLIYLLHDLEIIKENPMKKDALVLLGYGIVLGFGAIKVLQNTLTLIFPNPKPNSDTLKKIETA